eukprot:TRINITY_DN1634_c0_g1_i5.p1 TRINITY_DN1634_c0_g1~~TRINITY_DN1634_c0_g1_i5.p1  ORF type:complete len:338 (-),score=86.36 TRINITY_DN1634_c0_g1_i5:270-1283(-)
MEQDSQQTHSCRFYEEEFPEENDLVMVKVTKVEENATYVSLLEYNNIEGMITPNELTKIMKQNVQKALRVGKLEVVRVLRVDNQKGFIDLSKKKVNDNEIQVIRDRYANSKTVNSILWAISDKCKIEIEDLYKKIVWPISKEKKLTKDQKESHESKYNHPIEAFTLALNDHKIFDWLNLNEDLKKALLSEIERRLTPQTLKIMCEIEVACNTYEGIDAIKRALKEGESVSKPNCEVQFTILGSPVYLGKINTQDKAEGLKLLNQAIKKVQQSIELSKGTFKIKSEPKIYGEVAFDINDLLEQQGKFAASEDGDSEVEGMGSDDEEEEEEEKKQNNKD